MGFHCESSSGSALHVPVPRGALESFAEGCTPSLTSFLLMGPLSHQSLQQIVQSIAALSLLIRAAIAVSEPAAMRHLRSRCVEDDPGPVGVPHQSDQDRLARLTRGEGANELLLSLDGVAGGVS